MLLHSDIFAGSWVSVHRAEYYRLVSLVQGKSHSVLCHLTLLKLTWSFLTTLFAIMWDYNHNVDLMLDSFRSLYKFYHFFCLDFSHFQTILNFQINYNNLYVESYLIKPSVDWSQNRNCINLRLLVLVKGAVLTVLGTEDLCYPCNRHSR